MARARDLCRRRRILSRRRRPARNANIVRRRAGRLAPTIDGRQLRAAGASQFNLNADLMTTTPANPRRRSTCCKAAAASSSWSWSCVVNSASALVPTRDGHQLETGARRETSASIMTMSISAHHHRRPHLADFEFQSNHRVARAAPRCGPPLLLPVAAAVAVVSRSSGRTPPRLASAAASSLTSAVRFYCASAPVAKVVRPENGHRSKS
jgi:hypothetical protein